MGFETLVRQAVKVASNITKSLQIQVQHEAWIGEEAGFPKPMYAQPVGYQAIVIPGPRPYRTPSGDTIVVDAELYVLEPIVANGAANRNEPVDPRDRFTLPDGHRGTPVAGVPEKIPLDPGTGRPYAHVIGLSEA
jgi:hypothetical protein